MSGLEFADEAARQLEKAYLTRDVIAQRSETIRHLNLSPGERVLDIGCGPGFLCESIGEIVGPKGTIVGIDISADLIARCNGRKTSTCLSYEVGDATKLNQPNASFDVVVCTQVAEYVTDIDRVFSEALRVLKPNGRTVFVATDWRTVVFRQSKTHVGSHDILGRAFRPSAPANVHGEQVSSARDAARHVRSLASSRPRTVLF
jgi:arsenite methyltransferase